MQMLKCLLKSWVMLSGIWSFIGSITGLFSGRPANIYLFKAGIKTLAKGGVSKL